MPESVPLPSCVHFLPRAALYAALSPDFERCSQQGERLYIHMQPVGLLSGLLAVALDVNDLPPRTLPEYVRFHY